MGIEHKVTRRRRKVKQMLVAHFGGKCTICGYNKCIAALEFHHRNPKTKKFGISESGFTRAYSKLLREAKKCDLLCSNCHKEVESCGGA